MRKDSGLNQADLAAMTGVSRPNISFWENAEYPPLEAVVKVCRAFNIEVWRFFLPEDDEGMGMPMTDEMYGILQGMNHLSGNAAEDLLEIFKRLLYSYQQMDGPGPIYGEITGTMAEAGRTIKEGIQSQWGKPGNDNDSYRLPFYARKAGHSALKNYFNTFAWMEH